MLLPIVLFVMLLLLCIWIFCFNKGIIYTYNIRSMDTFNKNIEKMQSNPDIESFYKGSPLCGQYIKHLQGVCNEAYHFISHPLLKNLVAKTIVFDIDDTLVYTRPYNNGLPRDSEIYEGNEVVHYDALYPVVELCHRATRLGYYIVIITARPPDGYYNALSNLRRLGITPLALFTSLEWGQPNEFKAVMREKMEYIRPQQLSKMSSRELYEYKPPKMKNPLAVKVVLTIGDRITDVNGVRNTLGLKLPEEVDMNSYFIYNETVKLI